MPIITLKTGRNKCTDSKTTFLQRTDFWALILSETESVLHCVKLKQQQGDFHLFKHLGLKDYFTLSVQQKCSYSWMWIRVAKHGNNTMITHPDVTECVYFCRNVKSSEPGWNNNRTNLKTTWTVSSLDFWHFIEAAPWRNAGGLIAQAERV